MLWTITMKIQKGVVREKGSSMSDTIPYIVYLFILLVLLPIWISYTVQMVAQAWYRAKRDHVKRTILEGIFNGQKNDEDHKEN